MSFLEGRPSLMQSTWLRRLLFGHEPTPELLAILAIYFVQGILGLSRLAVSFFLKDDLGLTPAQVSALMGIVAIPWMTKPLIGFISDGFAIAGYNRRPYLVLSGVLGFLSWIALAWFVHSPGLATLSITLGSLSVAISDVIADSIVVERSRDAELAAVGSLQSLCWGASALGGLITAYLSGWLLQQFDAHTVFALTALFPLVVSMVAWAIVESPNYAPTNWQLVAEQWKQLRVAIATPQIGLPTAFLFLWNVTPTAESAFFFFTTNELGFSAEFLGRVRLVTSFASLVGIWVFQRFLKGVALRQIFAVSIVLSSLVGFSMLILVTHTNRLWGIDDHWFSLGDNLVITVLGQIAFMPVLVLAARLCPPGIEATLFALLMSVLNLAWALSGEISAVITHWLGITETQFESLWILVVIANVSTLLPLLFIHWLPKSEDLNHQDQKPQTLNSSSSELIVGEAPVL